MTAVSECDEIIVLEDGAVAARGTHDELIAQGGWYADMCHLQQAQAAA
jgi:ABC-type multidrug transport system fused ATPase/permease subunit